MTSETISVLNDILKWVKIIGLQQAQDVMRDALSDSDGDTANQLRIIYHLTDGQHSASDIANHVSVSSRTVSRRQQQWAKMGLVEKENQVSPYRHLITLEEAGLEVPDIPDPDGDNDD